VKRSGFRAQLAESASAFGSVSRNPGLRRISSSNAVWSIGGWGYSIAISVYAYDRGGASAVGLVWILRMVPSALLAPFTAVVADRMHRRAVMLASDALRFGVLLLATVAVWQGWAPVIVYVAAAVNAILATPYFAASSALLPTLSTTPAELTAANAVAGMIDSVGFFVGPAIVGVVLAATNVETAFLLTVATTLLSFTINAGLRVPEASRESDGESESAESESQSTVAAFGSQIFAGFKAIGSDGRLIVLLSIFAACCMLAGAIEVLIVSIAFNLLHVGNGAVGYLNAAFGVGALVGALITAGLVGARRLSRPFIAGALLSGAPLLIAGVPTRLGAIAGLALLGIGNPMIDVPCFTLLQRAVPEALLARVFGVLQLIWNGSVGIGAIVAPILISGLGVRGALVVAGCFVPALTIALWPRLVRIDAEAAAPAADRLELLRGTPIFAPLPGGSLESLARSLIPLEVREGDVIIREGEEGDRFYLVSEGRVDISAKGAYVSTVGPGEPLGEIALLRDVPRTATCTALTAVKLYALTREDFLSAVTSHEGSQKAAEATVSSRLAGLQSAIGRVAIPRG
jgi:MFS family permease